MNRAEFMDRMADILGNRVRSKHVAQAEERCEKRYDDARDDHACALLAAHNPAQRDTADQIFLARCEIALGKFRRSIAYGAFAKPEPSEREVSQFPLGPAVRRDKEAVS